MFVMPAGRNQQPPVLQRKHPHRQGIDYLQPLVRQEIGLYTFYKGALVAVDLVLQLVSGVAGHLGFHVLRVHQRQHQHIHEQSSLYRER